MDVDGGVTSCRSILEKPLSQLTEEDITQLTREDCRKFLKEKGMRRPSWNKSQAIQQVISLKALLESSGDSGSGVLRRVLVSPPESTPPRVNVTSNSADLVKEPTVSVSGDQNSAYRRKYPRNCAVDADNKTISNRNPCEANGSIGQMTIFYCGKVNVYEGVPTDKAQEIMHLAATPIDFSQNGSFGGITAYRAIPCHLQVTSNRHVSLPLRPAAMISQFMQTGKIADYSQEYREKAISTHDSDVDGQVNRKVSLQRYLEKRKDRGRFFKGKKNTGPTPSLEMYLNHPGKTHASNGQQSQSNTSSPTQPELSNTLGTSPDNQAKTVMLPVDLNNEDNGSG
ncbi:hypothetical protein AB3S75_044449 [Citrus x aurantiifolia]